MKKLLPLLLLLVLQAAGQTAADSAWFMQHYVKKEFQLPMRDGVKLFTTVYMPREAVEKHPIIMTRTPYSCAPYGENNYARLWERQWMHFFREGYIFVQQDVRGRWMSEGVFQDVRPFNPNKKGKETDEASDTYDTIDWLIKNLPDNNGRVGVFGISYPGFYSSMATLSQHPALKAVSPQAPVTEWFMGDDFHHNGAFMLMDGFSFYSGFGKPRPTPTTVGPKGFDFPTQDNYGFYLRTGALPNFTKLMGDSILFWKELMDHPNYDEWWKARDVQRHVQQIPQQTATLVVGGLFDAEDCYGAWNLYGSIEKKAKNNNKIVMGPWYHGQWSRYDGKSLGKVRWDSNTSEWYAKNVELPFFNYHLKKKGDKDPLQEATIFFTGENQWRQLPQWPVANVSYEAYALLKGGGLSKAVPLIAPLSSYEQYESDPAKPVPYAEGVHFRRTREYMTDDQRFAARRPDVLVYQTPVLDNDVTLGGPLVADLMVAISGTDADFVVKLIDVFPDDFSYGPNDPNVMNGYQMLVRGEIMRGKFRDSFEKPSPFTPNKPTRVKFSLPDVAHTFKKGHRIMVQVQSSWFPLVDRNPQQFLDIYKAKDSDFKKATIRIYNNDSKIILPVIK